MAKKSKKRERDWYTISVTSFRKGMTLIALVLTLIGISVVYQQWEQRTIRDRAENSIVEASDLARDLEDREDFDQIRIEHHLAWEDLKDAETEFEGGRYGPALNRARSALREFDNIFDLGASGTERKSRFLSVQGGVEYRRGERGSWKKARANDSLNPGDWVKTSDEGTAEIRFPDGSTYVLREDTLVHLGTLFDSPSGNEPVADLQFGLVDFNTAQSGSKIKTPKSEAILQKDTEATISYDPDSAAGHYTTFAGSAKVTSTSGQTREIGALQQVDQKGEELSDAKPVPPSPQLVGPANGQEIDFDSQKELRLAWKNLPEIARYTLNVSQSQIFGANIIEDDHRRKSSARVGIRGEGIFYWRVAAYDRSGARGAWSETRSFRVASLGGVGAIEDTTPPALTIEEAQAYGSLVLVNGRTEPGAKVNINDEPASVQLNGSFSKTIQMTQTGFAFITIVATDAWNNKSEVKRRVFIDAF
ncbi:MAG: hypothetical protein GY719_29100 [bacterium]|nr:hypothetical protein [bacterium]